MERPLLEIDQLRKSYGTFEALRDVSLQVRRGEIFALLGPNGAGKTTLIGVVAGLVRRNAGSVRVDGWDVERDYLTTRRLVGLVPQELNFDPFFNVEELLRFQAGYFGVALTPAALDELLAAVGLTDQRRRTTRALSGGMKRRLLIAKALVHRPALLFLDEPSAGVDVELRRDLWAYVRRLRDAGTTVVLTTHYIEEAEELADRVGVIDHGRLLLVEDKATLMQRMGRRQVAALLTTPIASLPPAAVEAGWTLERDGLRVVREAPSAEPVGPALRQLLSAGVDVHDLEVRPPRLEEVFRQLVAAGEGASR